MIEDHERWDARHRAAFASPSGAPDEFFLEALAFLGSAAAGSALDLAAGRGRHALELSRRGFETEAWDISSVALDFLANEAAERGLAIATSVVDLAAGLPADPSSYDLVVVVDFLDRALMTGLWRLVSPGGHALVSTFTTDRPGDHPSDRWCLTPGELAAGLPELETVLERERAGRAGLIARRGGRR
ncbi:MAG: methyltransferase domain-containing protein [Planctomycetota bacterium]|nr:methyltransferase domain-containing protein [Planctomycetota bacterium]